MVRAANFSDTSSIMSIYNFYVKEGKSTLDKEKTLSDIKHWIEKLVDREAMFVSEFNGEMSGWGVVKKYSDRHGYRFAAEISIYVHPDFKQKGVGGELNSHAEQLAKSFDYKHLTTKIFATNQASLSFFTKAGYQLVGTQHQIGFILDEWVDVVIMEKRL